MASGVMSPEGIAERATESCSSMKRRMSASGQSRNVTLKKRLPVLLTYWTAWVDPQGRTHFRRDLYGQDDKWSKALEAPFKLRAKPLFSAAAQ